MNCGEGTRKDTKRLRSEDILRICILWVQRTEKCHHQQTENNAVSLFVELGDSRVPHTKFKGRKKRTSTPTFPNIPKTARFFWQAHVQLVILVHVRLHTTAREPKRAHLRVPALQTPPDFHEKTPRERKDTRRPQSKKKKRENGAGRGKKKARKFVWADVKSCGGWSCGSVPAAAFRRFFPKWAPTRFPYTGPDSSFPFAHLTA